MEKVLLDIYRVALGLSWPLAIAALLATGIVYYIAYQLGKDREELRTLRVSLEKNPTPAQIGQGIRMWPEVSQFPSGLQIQEMIKRANTEENRRAERVQVVLGYFRLIGFIAFIGVALIVAGFFFRPS